MRAFNTTGLCVPWKHYMVDISGRVAQMRALVDHGDYVCMSRPRQFGKTTSLAALRRALTVGYDVASLDFQGLSHANFRTEGHFVRSFCRMLAHAATLPPGVAEEFSALERGDTADLALDDLFFVFRDWCGGSRRPVVLIIDEVDSATNNQVFWDFLAQLRLGYLMHEENPAYPTFRSVVLAGVTDVRYLTATNRSDGESGVTIVWNIATEFDVDMSFSVADVAGMIGDFEADHATGMDVASVAEEIVAWTGGYPYLVSRICQLVVDRGLTWDQSGVNAAVRQLLKDDGVCLFASLMETLRDHPELRRQLRAALMQGEQIAYLPYDEAQRQLRTHGFVVERDGTLIVADRVFESLLYEQFIGEGRSGAQAFFQTGDLDRTLIVAGAHLDMCAVLEGFRRTYTEVCGPLEEGGRFPVKDGRELFLAYLTSIIGNSGTPYVEAQTRDQTRTDVVVDYGGERFVVELRLWRGPPDREAACGPSESLRSASWLPAVLRLHQAHGTRPEARLGGRSRALRGDGLKHPGG